MKVLLDVNALLAWEHANSPHHAVFHEWVAQSRPELWTCALTELGFIRVSMQVFGYDRTTAKTALKRIKKATDGFVSEAPSPELPQWTKSARQTTDASLVQLAAENRLRLATFDRAIKDPSAVLITG